jgi:hypothetical protein
MEKVRGTLCRWKFCTRSKKHYELEIIPITSGIAKEAKINPTIIFLQRYCFCYNWDRKGTRNIFCCIWDQIKKIEELEAIMMYNRASLSTIPCTIKYFLILLLLLGPTTS